MGQDGKRALIGILWELLRELMRLEAIAYSVAQHMEDRGLEDEASKLWDLYMVAKDWVDEVATWIEDLAQGTEGGDE